MKRLLLVICMLSMGSLAWAQSAPPLASAQTFAVLGASTVTNTGPSIITGDLGVSPGTAVTGFPPGTVTGGIIHAGDATALSAQADAHTAYAALVAEICGTNLTGKTLGTSPGAVTLSPGAYCFDSSAQLTGTLTLNGNGVYVFQMKSTLTTASNSSVVLANGATGGNVFWQVGSSATLGTNTVFAGSILALISDTVTTGTSVCGRVFALTGAVTQDSNAITATGSCGGSSGTGGGGTGGGQQCKDFTTGRGHITGPSGNEAKFEFKVGFKGDESGNSSPRGEVIYVDDGFECSLRVRSTSVTAYLGKGPNSRRIQGTAEINGHDGTFQLDVTDDESASDSFAIRLSNGYSATGKLKKGHIEIRKHCPGDKDDKDDKDHKDNKDKDEDH
ncbi:MAG TPA: ice-binding family protein [Candidatus Acidoferrum sp.]